MTALFSLTVLAAAALNFGLQPMVGRMLLPVLGGAPAVWLSCMLFFQAALLAGYLWAHALAKRGNLTLQLAAHAVLTAGAACLLPFSFANAGIPPDAGQAGWILMRLATTVGLPYVALSASAPLLQEWYSATTHEDAGDPYFLYAASNIGSFGALVAYPLLIEPRMGLTAQDRWWTRGFWALVVLVAACGLAARKNAKTAADAASAGPPLTIGRRALWVARAFIPSSLMLAVTTYMTTDVAPVPLLWVIPLGIYLLSFAAAFSRRAPRYPPPIAAAVLVTLAALLVINPPLGPAVAGHAVALFVVGLTFHGALADDRPDPGHLTEFYWWLAVGGALGGLFNAIAAPLCFLKPIEHILTMAAACALLPLASGETLDGDSSPREAIAPLLIAAAAGGVGYFAAYETPDGAPSWVPHALHIAFTLALPAFACWLQRRRPLRWRLGLASIIAVCLLMPWPGEGKVLHRERGFFGALSVKVNPSGTYHTLVHGTTIHGRQSLDPARRWKPLMYYHLDSPIGRAFSMLEGRGLRPRFAVVGLGAGGLATYAWPRQEVVFYEINPAVVRIARDPRLFTYLDDAERRGAVVRVVLGDARRSLAAETGAPYGLIILDAFSSDAIPVHLLTREALRLYVSRLAPGGMVAFHVSNRYLKLESMLARLAREEGLVGLLGSNKEDVGTGKAASTWVFMARRKRDLGDLGGQDPWKPLDRVPEASAWTDEASSLLPIARW